jgi:CheY-like chemotaxis protein
VVEADNGQKGLEEAKRENPDLVLLDVRMPVMDGMTMLDQLRQIEVGKKMKVIILTNYEPDDRVVGQVVDDKPTYFFIKSNIELSFLFEKIDELLAE